MQCPEAEYEQECPQFEEDIQMEKPEQKPRIPSHILEDFVSNDKKALGEKYLKTDCKHVGNDNFRINIWSSFRKPNAHVRTNRIAYSYYVMLTKDGIVDQTKEMPEHIRQEIEKRKMFS